MNLTQPGEGIVLKKGSKLYLKLSNDELYLIHFTDIERLKLKAGQAIEGLLFRLKEPVREQGNLVVHGWIYPGVIKVKEGLEQKATESDTESSSENENLDG